MKEVTPDDVERAAELIAPRLRLTPILELESGALLPTPVTLKCEQMQVTGSFKPRGVFSTMLAREQLPAGVVAASGGNHAKAVAYAASALGVPAHVFIPSTSPVDKIAAVRALGAEVTVVAGTYTDAAAAAEARAAELGRPSLHPYEGFELVAGQGTLARELSRQQPDLDTVLVAVGGGGLISGVASWYRDAVKIVAVETPGTAGYRTSVTAGEPVDVAAAGSCVSSLGAIRIGAYLWTVARQWIDDAVLVEDEAIAETQGRLWDSARIATEPGGAAALAALRSGSYLPEPGERVGAVVCGANVKIEFAG